MLMMTERLPYHALEAVTLDSQFEVFFCCDQAQTGLGDRVTMTGQNQKRIVTDFGFHMVEDPGVVRGIQQALLALEDERFHAAALVTTQSDACGLWRDGEPVPDGRSW